MASFRVDQPFCFVTAQPNECNSKIAKKKTMKNSTNSIERRRPIVRSLDEGTRGTLNEARIIVTQRRQLLSSSINVTCASKRQNRRTATPATHTGKRFWSRARACHSKRQTAARVRRKALAHLHQIRQRPFGRGGCPRNVAISLYMYLPLGADAARCRSIKQPTGK